MIESETHPHIIDLGSDDIHTILERIHFGHLGLCDEGRPYVIPMHFAYARPGIYFYTTEGMKTEILDKNPMVCLQVEDIRRPDDWESVIVTGNAEQLTTEDEIESAMRLIKKVNPTLSPAWSVRWLDNWIRSNVDVVYRISPEVVCGRRAYKKDHSKARS